MEIADMHSGTDAYAPDMDKEPQHSGQFTQIASDFRTVLFFFKTWKKAAKILYTSVLGIPNL